jgi:hypothetical protein
MNFRRGLFRLWLVASVVYVFAIAFDRVPRIANQFQDASPAFANTIFTQACKISLSEATDP